MRVLPSTSHLCTLAFLYAQASAYFIINNPTDKSPWVNGATNLAKWTKGLHDGVFSFDIELARLSHEGLTFVAKDVPATQHSLNLALQDVPPGDDYFLIFINSTHGVMYATSPRFTILDAGKQNPSPAADGSAPTVTISGSPNPTKPFATTFPPVAGAALSGHLSQGWLSLLGASVVGVMSGTWLLS
jgi:hypothetical protein